ncbi:hypothetical protein [Hymenobacter jeollabukensis]|uniref:Uncharacterized protein n=1 Tax=Hymenobacter jeollabukensis TaxID=2025313 RepID=A0A5R8WH00_9BACT|nr:hypothetical protein [Hymenobacter jeollabukensis]TLM87352.1 hypothetical protein FDY95_26035 [Hymenobacter jeollabukensis]
MHQCLVVFLSLLILLQSFSREVLVLDYALHRQRITEQFCVNKNRPQLRCNGRCHLRKQLAKTDDAEKKAPQNHAKLKFEALPLTRFCYQPPRRTMPAVRAGFGQLRAPRIGMEVNRDVFRPPVLRR